MTPGLFGGVSQIGIEEVYRKPRPYDAELKLTAPAWQHIGGPSSTLRPRSMRARSLLPVTRVEGVTWSMSLRSRSRQPDRRPGRGGSRSTAVTMPRSRAASRCSSTGAAPRTTLPAAAARRSTCCSTRRSARCASPATSRATAPCCCRKAARRSRPTSRAGASCSTSSAPRTSGRSCASPKAHGMKPVIAGGAEAWVVARRARGTPTCP